MRVNFFCGQPSDDPNKHYANFDRDISIPPRNGDMIIRHKDGPHGYPRTIIYTVKRTIFVFEDRDSYTTPESIKGGYGGDRLSIELDFVEERVTAREELEAELRTTMSAINKVIE